MQSKKKGTKRAWHTLSKKVTITTLYVRKLIFSIAFLPLSPSFWKPSGVLKNAFKRICQLKQQGFKSTAKQHAVMRMCMLGDPRCNTWLFTHKWVTGRWHAIAPISGEREIWDISAVSGLFEYTDSGFPIQRSQCHNVSHYGWGRICKANRFRGNAGKAAASEISMRCQMVNSNTSIKKSVLKKATHLLIKRTDCSLTLIYSASAAWGVLKTFLF